MRVVDEGAYEVIVVDEAVSNAADAPVSGQTQYLNLSFNALTSLTGLNKATQLRNLNVSHNAIACMRGVETFMHLQLLRCSYNQISELHWLRALPNLCELWVNENQIEAAQLVHLASLPKLHALVLHPNPCTNSVHYVSSVIKTVPWLSRVDAVVVDDDMRANAQHLHDRVQLSSAASDESEISLMTTRSSECEAEQRNEGADDTVERPEHTALLPTEKETVPQGRKAKKSQKMSAEDFMRAFPVQDYIPATPENVNNANFVMHETIDDTIVAAPLESPENMLDIISNEPNPVNLAPVANDKHVTPESVQDRGDHQNAISNTENVCEGNAETPEPILSAIASSVLSLPSFDFGKKKNQARVTSNNAQAKKKSASTSVSSGSGDSKVNPVADSELTSFHQEEWTLAYPNSTVNAILIRSDGSAIAKWPNGNVAISIDRERDGFRSYAAHKDGVVSLSFDAAGVGFINYYPSGRMMISTSSSGDGLYFSGDGSTILRQWDSALNMKDENWQPTVALGDETDGALLVKLSDSLGVRVRLHMGNRGSTSPIELEIYFASQGIRHVFQNWMNHSVENSDACDVLFGKPIEKATKKKSEVPTRSHTDTLSDIRTAVANLS